MMTVRELRRKLLEYPEGAEVYVQDSPLASIEQSVGDDDKPIVLLWSEEET